MSTIHSILLRPERKAAPRLVTEAIIRKNGIEGDHHFKPDSKRTVTLISNKALAEVAAIVGFPGNAHEASRRNICVDTLPEENMIGKKIALGDEVLLEVTCYCAPCKRMDENFGKGAVEAMHEKAGWGAVVLREGGVKTGDAFVVL